MVRGRCDRETPLITVTLSPSTTNEPASSAANVTARDVDPGSAVRHAKRFLFVIVTGLAAGSIGAGCLALAVAIMDGTSVLPLFGHGIPSAARPYVPTVFFAAEIRALLYLWFRHEENRRPRGFVDEVGEAVREAALGSVALIIFTFFWRGGTVYRTFSYSRGVFLLDWLIASVALSVHASVVKLTLAWLRKRGNNLRNVVVVGDSPAARSFLQVLGKHPETGYRAIAHLRDGISTHRDFVEELKSVSGKCPVDEVVLAGAGITRQEIARLVSTPELQGLEVRAVPELFGLPPSKMGLEPVVEFPMLGLLRDPLVGTRATIKRLMDLLVGTATLVVVSPILAVAAAAIRLTSPGPILFRQQRVGMDGRPFEIMKFRSMVDGNGSRIHEDYVIDLIKGDAKSTVDEGPYFKLVDDPRITRVGRILRRLSIDELPQLFNVLRGDMSLVGPRPALAYEVAAYDTRHLRRLEVRPGMTGLWQVSGRSRLGFDDMVRLDVQYIDNWSPVQDAKILLRTIPAVVHANAS